MREDLSVWEFRTGTKFGRGLPVPIQTTRGASVVTGAWSPVSCPTRVQTTGKGEAEGVFVGMGC